MENMKNSSLKCSFWLSATLATFAAAVQADVTIQQKTSLDVASLVHLHGAITTNITADKKREDNESHCEGMMSLLCGNVQSGEIVRLDRDLTWHLEPKKKRYREQAFATPEEILFRKASSPSINPNARCRRRKSRSTRPTLECRSPVMRRRKHRQH
jgi:hypothetical protein